MLGVYSIDRRERLLALHVRGEQWVAWGAGGIHAYSWNGDLPIGERAWISMIIRNGEPAQPRGGTVIEAGDELLVLTETRDAKALRRLFEGAGAGPHST